MAEYDPLTIEQKWQKRWLDENLFGANAVSSREKMYILDMFPYPSGDGLHVGHVKIYTAADVVSRYLRMKGFNVLHPTGWDAFGLPTENTAIKKQIHPAELTKKNIERFRGQMQQMGFSYDWDREINTTDPEYVKWTQWIFLQLYQMGLAYEATAPINWCPSCKTGLANEEVVDQKCERCGTEVVEKPMRQWMLRITKYADQLLEGLGGLDWPVFVKELQKNWIGKSEGVRITFPVFDQPGAKLEVFTTRPDTIFGVTCLLLSPHYPDLQTLVAQSQKDEVDQYVANAVHLSDRDADEKEKTGVFTGSYVMHPITNEKIPIWVSDYVLMTYGSGAVMGVPAHDERDFDFATKFKIPIQQVIVPKRAEGETKLPYEGDGVLMNSGDFDGKESAVAAKSIIEKLRIQGLAKRATNYRLRDWVFSRQRYWGEPIPLIHCDKCGIVPVPEEDLPVLLPEVDEYRPTGTGESPLALVEDWVNVKCPTCPGVGKRETNTMPQWAGSSWYWMRYPNANLQEAFADRETLNHWLPVDVYIGGSEHAVLHLLYARFWHKALYDLGLVPGKEPFKRFRAVGLVLGEDGEKMSKSRGNVVNPDDVVAEYGTDTLRVYEMFMGPFDGSVAWNTDGIKGSRRFLERVWSYFEKQVENTTSDLPDDPEVSLRLHQTIRRVSESTEQFKFNTAISGMMELLNVLESKEQQPKEVLSTFALLLAPYAPHMAEELWLKLGHTQSLMYEGWPEVDKEILKKAEVTIVVQVNGKVRAEFTAMPGIQQKDAENQALKLSNIAKYLEGKTVRKAIFVPDKLLNFVVSN